MTNPMQSDPDRLRLALDNGEEVELDGGTLLLGEEESPSVLLRLTPWRARSVARVLEEWSAVSFRSFGSEASPKFVNGVLATAVGGRKEPSA